MKPQVSILPTEDYARAEEAIRRHFELLHVKDLIPPGSRVLLKPNLLLKRTPEEGTTTHPAMVRGVARVLREYGVTDITLADSPGGPFTVGALRGIYAASGMEAVCREENIKLNFDTSFENVPSDGGRLCSAFHLIQPVVQADVIINLPKLKTHCMTMLSGGVKNLFGCIPGLQKPEMHYRFQNAAQFGQMLVDLAGTVKPVVTVVDAVLSMEGDGPSGGELRQTGLTVASTDLYALDYLLASLIGVPHTSVPTIAAALERGISPRSLAEIELLPDADAFVPIPDFKKPKSRTVDFNQSVPKLLRPITAFAGKRLLAPKPQIRHSACVGCGKCAESCPMHAIRVIDGKAHIDAQKCVKCFCCHEMCPIKAIRIRRFNVFDL